MKTRIALMVLVSLSWSVCALGTVVYNANDEFSISNGNPNGVWTYGYSDFATVYDGSTVFDHPANWANGGRLDGGGLATTNIDVWSLSYNDDPMVSHNPTASPISDFGFTWGPNDIGLDSYGEMASIIQWKAPSAGVAVASVAFDPSGTTAYEGFNGLTAKWQENSAGTTWSDTFTVNAGDCIAFATGGAGTVTMFRESISFTAAPEPGTIVLLVTGLLGLLAYAWRKRK